MTFENLAWLYWFGLSLADEISVNHYTVSSAGWITFDWCRNSQRVRESSQIEFVTKLIRPTVYSDINCVYLPVSIFSTFGVGEHLSNAFGFYWFGDRLPFQKPPCVSMASLYSTHTP